MSVSRIVLDAVHTLSHPNERMIKDYVNAHRRCSWLSMFWAIEGLQARGHIYTWWIDGVRHFYPTERM